MGVKLTSEADVCEVHKCEVDGYEVGKHEHKADSDKCEVGNTKLMG